MKKFLLVFTVLGLLLTGCGSNNDSDNIETTTENVETESTTDDTTIVDDETSTKSEDDDIIKPKDKENKNSEDTKDNKESDNGNKTTKGVFDNPEVTKASPVDNVSNALFVDVSSAVRNNCNYSNNNSTNTAALSKKWSDMAKTPEEKTYINTATKLIDSYARLNNCRKLVYDNNDVVTDEDIELLTNIEEGLGANVEIFLNTDTTSVMDSNFAYGNELDKLELSVQNKAK